MPVEKEGVVFGSTKNGLMFGLDAHTGKVLWKHKVGNSLISTLVPLSKNKCLFTATGGGKRMVWKELSNNFPYENNKLFHTFFW